MGQSDKPIDPLADSLGIETELELYRPGEVAPIDDQIEDDKFQTIVDADYDFARRQTTDAIITAAKALEKIVAVAEQSQAPRAYEVVATLAKVIFDGNKDLLDLAKRTKDLKEIDVSAEEGKTINNNLIVTTDQLQRMLEDQGIVTTTRVVKKRPEQDEVKDNGTAGRAEGS